MPGIRDMFWVNDNSYVIVFEVTIHDTTFLLDD